MAVELNGTDQAVNLDAHGAALDFTTAGFSIYIEFATTQTSFQWMIVHGRQQATFETEYGIAIENGSVQGVTTTPGDGLVITSDSLGGTWDDGNLHRVLFVVAAGLGQVELWIDGAQRDTATLTDTDISNINDLTSIGYSSETDVFWFDGELSSAAVWGVDVSADAADLTNGTINPGDLLTGIVEWWPLDFDARGQVNGLDGTPVNNPSFTEVPIPPTPAHRWRVSELEGFSDTDPVTTLPDEIGSHDLTSDNDTQTTYSASGIGGVPAIQTTTATDSRLLGPAAPSLALTQPLTYVAIMQFTSLTFSGPDTTAIVVDSIGDRAPLYIGGGPGSKEWRMFAGSAEVTSGEPPDLDAHMILGRFDGASSVLRLDGAQIATGNPGTEGITRVVVNADGDSIASSTGHGAMLIAEILIYDRVLSGGDLTTLVDYAATVYGIGAPVVAPSVEAQPGTAHPVGQTASLELPIQLDAQPGTAHPAGQVASLEFAPIQLDAQPGTTHPVGQVASLELVAAVRLDALPGEAFPAGQIASLTGVAAVAVPGRPIQPTGALRAIQPDAAARTIQPTWPGVP